MRYATLCLPFCANKDTGQITDVLLAVKKVGFGKGKIVGIGGGIGDCIRGGIGGGIGVWHLHARTAIRLHGRKGNLANVNTTCGRQT